MGFNIFIKTFFRFLQVISLKKYDVMQLVAVVKSLLKITENLISEMMKNIKNTVAKILTLLIELFHYVSNCR